MSGNTYDLNSGRLGYILLWGYIFVLAIPIFFAFKFGFVSHTSFTLSSLLLGAALSIFSLINLEFGVCVLIVLAPFPGMVASKMFDIYSFNAFNMVYYAVCLNILLSAIYGRREIKFWTPITIPLLLFLLVDFVARLREGNFFEINSVKFWFENFLKPIQYMGLFFIVLNAIENQKSIYKYLTVMVGITTFVSIVETINALQYMKLDGSGYTFPYRSDLDTIIANGIHGMGISVALLVPLMLALLYAVKSKGVKIALLVCIALCFPIPVFSDSRSALVSLMFALIFFLIVERKKHLFIVLLALLVLSPFYLPGSIKDKFAINVWTKVMDTSGDYYREFKMILKGELESSTPTIEGEKQWWAVEGTLWELNNAATGRFLIWTGVYRFIKDNISPFFVLFGGGAGVFEFNAPRYIPAIGQHSDIHNQYVEIFINEGLIGLFIFFWLFYVMFQESLLLYIKSEQEIFKAIGLGAASYLLMLLLINLIATRFPAGDLNTYLWVLLSMVVWIKSNPMAD